MAELPPKPSITQNWPSFSHQRMSSNFMSNTTNTTGTATTTPSATTSQKQLPSWVDEFLDFSSARRGSHRRSASDSIAFLDTPFLLDDIRSFDDGAVMAGIAAHSFDGLNVDDQFISMFSDDITLASPSATAASPSNPSSPLDQNSNDDDKATALDGVVPMQEHDQHPKIEACELESSCRSDAAAVASPSAARTSTETVVDPKRVKRILANRQSAQRSRVRKLQYISELERSVTSLQTEVSALSPRVAFLDHQRLILNADNGTLKQRIAALAQDNIFKDAHQQALKKEMERLRQIYHQQNRQKMGKLVNNNGQSLHSPRPSQPQTPMPPHSASTVNSISAFGM